MFFNPRRKRRSFNFPGRLGKDDKADDERKIKFERLPKRKVRSFWLTLFVFLMVVLLLYYLDKF